MATSNDQIYSRLGTLEGTVKTFVEELRDRMDRDDQDRDKIEKRVRSVEKKQYWMAGVFSGLSFVASTMLHRLMGGQPQI